jgi:hypothetical protein
LILAFFQLARDLVGKQKDHAAADIDPAVARRRTITIIFWTVGCFVAIWLLGFSYAVPLIILAYLRFAGRESWIMTAIVTFCAWLFFWALFEKMLNVPFPEGFLITLIKGGG